MDQTRLPLISVVSPAFNEAPIIGEVVKEWTLVLEEKGREWEIVIADDGSTDGTYEALVGLNEPRLRPVRLDRNYGYGPALFAAMAAARGEYLVTIDCDGQFDLKDFSGLFDKLEEDGYDLVTGYRRSKQDTLFKVMGDRVLNLIVRVFFGLDLADTNCALKVMKREVAQALRVEAVGFPTPTEILVRAAEMGYKIGEGPVSHRPRRGGKSKLHALRGSIEFILFLCYLRFQLFLKRRRVIQGKRT